MFNLSSFRAAVGIYKSSCFGSNGSKRFLSNYDRFFNKTGKARQPSAIRSLQPFLSIPGMISLGGGFPNPNSFPIKSFEMELKNGKKIKIQDAQLNTALQYSDSKGLAGLTKWMKDKQILEHQPKTNPDEWDVGVFTGSQDGLSKTFDLLVTRGDNVLVEAPTYSGSLASLRPLGPNLIGIPTDGDGMQTSELKNILENWDSSKGDKPKILYTVPSGSNPTGASLSVPRRHELLQLCTEHDLLIIEDDPYYYLQFGQRLPSLFSLCKDGRVIRADSFSKIISSGIRIGFITAPKPVMERLVLHQQSSSMHVSGISQAVTLSLLEEWQNEGFEKHVESVVEMMRERKDAFIQSAKKHLKGKAEWNEPQAGMFVWMKLYNVKDTTDLIQKKAKENKVLFVPGSVFMPNEEPTQYVRAAFSYCSMEDMDTGLQRLAKTLET